MMEQRRCRDMVVVCRAMVVICRGAKFRMHQSVGREMARVCLGTSIAWTGSAKKTFGEAFCDVVCQVLRA